MEPKRMRKTIDDLLAELQRNPRIGRRSTFMARYGRPLGFGLAVGMGGMASCGDDTGGPRDALPSSSDIYAASLPPARDGGQVDSAVDLAIQDALPPSPDIYAAFDRPMPTDLPAPSLDGSIVDGPTRDALPPAADIYAARDRPPAIDMPGRPDTDAPEIVGVTVDVATRPG